MIGVDTNVVVRLIVLDDRKQTDLAETQLQRGMFISHGVLIETEWVLRSVYGFDRSRTCQELLRLLDLAGVEVGGLSDVLWAVGRHREGADLADMLHLVSSRDQLAFVTFDRDLPRDAGSDTPVAVELLV